jgi:putative heme-binding domain-containing protein
LSALTTAEEPAKVQEALEPVIRMLVPGFTVRELPAKLTNINDVLYAPDGRLFAAGYDGRIHVLRDTNGDGLEDKVEEFWYKPTLRTPLGMVLAPEGLDVVANAKVVLLKDTDEDGRADREEIVSTDWVTDDAVTGGGVDALGLAIDKDNNLFFGLGCANFANAYRMKDGKAHYDIKSERGTILKVSPDRKTREIFCTGYRFSINLAINRHGDLFGTDQEGETWLPGGNPRDELNHIQKGKHYGFPPRHPEHLPNVVDEPPVIAFGPQHQSTCGLLFNEAGPNQKSFGPEFWEGDALVCGFSRGKLWRAKLVKTPQGYVGRETLIATSSLMLFDAALSPRGDLVVSCHVGPPDWGVGPQGEGKLFKISYTSDKLAQPVLAWAASPIEARVAFDRPLPPSADELVKKLAGTQIEYGENVRAADRFEKLKPPYEVVKQQDQTPRGKLPIVSARLSGDRRTLILTTHPHPLPVHYALSLLMALVDPQADAAATIELDYSLHGVEARWTSAQQASASNGPSKRPASDGNKPESAWLPHRDITVALELMRGSAEQERLKKELVDKGADFSMHFKKPSLSAGALASIAALSPQQYLVPWAPDAIASPEATLPATSATAVGDVRRGKDLFFSDIAKCGSCHTVRGEGAKLGPDLSNLAHRDRESILRDIVAPSAVINPDYVSYTAQLRDGRSVTGVLRPQGADTLRVIDANAKETVFPLSDIEQLLPAKGSIMPEGIDKELSSGDVDDLLAFLTQATASDDTAAKQPPRQTPPPPRKRSEVEKTLGKTAAAAKAGNADARTTKPRPLHIVLVDAKQDHGPGEHDYPAWKKKWTDLFGKAEKVTIDTAYEWPSDEQWRKADLVVCYFWNHDWSPARYRELDAYLARGGGLVMIHSSTIADRAPEQLADRIGLAFQPGKSKYRHGPLDLKIEAAADEPITHGLPREIHFYDESYWPMFGDLKRVKVLATAVEEGKPWPMVWTCEPTTDEVGEKGAEARKEQNKGRVFCSILGHYSWTFDDPLFRVLVLRGAAWAAREPIERFEPLVTEGVQLSD